MIHWIIPKVEQQICPNKRCKVKIHGCPKLVTLDIHGESSEEKYAVSEKVLTQLLLSFSALKSFSCYVDKIFDLKSITDHNVTEIENLNLEDANFQYAYFDDIPKDFELLPSIFPRLKHLKVKICVTQLHNLINCSNLVEIQLEVENNAEDDSSLRIHSFFETHPNVRNFKKISIRTYLDVKETIFIVFATKCPDITHLSFNAMNSFDAKKLKPSEQSFKKLKELRLDFTIESLEAIIKIVSYVLVQAVNVEKVQLMHFDWDIDLDWDVLVDEIMKKNPQLGLKELTLYSIPGIVMSQETLKKLSNLPNLRKLAIPGLKWKAGHIETVEALKKHAIENNLDISYDIPIYRRRW